MGKEDRALDQMQGTTLTLMGVRGAIITVQERGCAQESKLHSQVGSGEPSLFRDMASIQEKIRGVKRDRL